MSNNLEIERKFLVSDTSWLNENAQYKIIHQYYLDTTPDWEERIRLVFSQSGVCLFAVHTLKSTGKELTRQEFERKIPIADATDLINDAIAVVCKKRYVVELNGVSIEIDYFKDEKLWIAEIEFDTMEQATSFIPTNWLGTEVTGNPAFYNRNIATRLK